MSKAEYYAKNLKKYQYDDLIDNTFYPNISIDTDVLAEICQGYADQEHQSRLKEGLMNFAEHWNDDNIGFECTRITSEEVEEYLNKLKQDQ